MSRKTSLLFQIIRGLVRLFYGKMEVVGTENLPERNAILVGNHCQMNGPIAGELFLPKNCYTWCAGQMMELKEVPAYAFADFWSRKPGFLQPLYRVLSYIIAPLSVCVFNNARTIPVYRDMRIMGTFKKTVQMMQEGANILIFPERDEPDNNILYRFRENFVDVAKLYHKKTGEEPIFVPVYIAPRLRRIYIGKGITFDSERPIAEERVRITTSMSAAVTAMARELPLHTVVPYRNLPRRYYLTNKDVDLRPGKMVSEFRPGGFRKPVVDYREFRLSRLKEPRFYHLLYLLGWVGYFTLYFLTEKLIPAQECYPVHCWLDDLIPFCEYFVIPYVGWYVLIVVSLLYFALYNPKLFKGLMSFIIVTQVAAMFIYIVFPNRQDLRPLEFTRDNIFTDILRLLYTFDTSTNVCPSLHVAYSIGIASTWQKESEASRRAKVFVTVFCVFVCISVVFVKQHSAVDIFAALPIALLAEYIAYGKSYWKERAGKRKGMVAS